ncbi:MAG TPA: Ig-like domain-containing protein, partial [Solirubrobacteraceae bacterium]
MPQITQLRRLLAPGVLLLALAAAGPAYGEQCEDCEPPPDPVETFETPQTTIYSTGPVLTRNDQPQFGYRSDIGGVRFRCSVKTGATTTSFDCGTSSGSDNSASIKLGPLPDGSHTFGVAACKDYATTTRCDGSPATYAFTIDTAAPSLSVSGSDAPVYAKTPPAFSLSSTASDLEEIQCLRSDLDAWSTCASSFTWPSTLADGQYSVDFHAVDQAGNSSASVRRTWVKDTVAPVATVSGPSGAINVRRPKWTWTVQDADAQTSALCSFDGSLPGPCAGGSWTPQQDLADNTYTFYVRFADRAGNESAWVQKQIEVDTIAPWIGEIAWDATTKRLTFPHEDGTLRCRFDEGEPFSCTDDVDAGGLDDGEHKLTVTLTDAAGNATTKAKAFRVGAEPDGGDGGGDGSGGDGDGDGGSGDGDGGGGDGDGDGDGGDGGDPSTGGVTGGAWAP